MLMADHGLAGMYQGAKKCGSRCLDRCVILAEVHIYLNLGPHAGPLEKVGNHVGGLLVVKVTCCQSIMAQP